MLLALITYEYETVGVSSTNFNLRLQSPNSLLFHTGGAERLTITSNGDVGIGTPTPERPLQIDHRRGMIITADGVGLFHAGRTAGNAGSAVVRGANDSVNAALGHLTADPNLGFISVHHSAGQEKARMYVWTDGRGYVEADVKSFRVPNPGRPGTEIAYAAIEGPEAAAYARGTARLERGRAIVDLPDHFASVAGAQRLTVQLTPGSAESLGLAVVAKSPERLVVQELMNGTGTYEFDWEVKSVRKGYEDYRVIQPALGAGVFQLDEGSEH